MEIELEGSTESQRTVYYAMGGAFRIIGGSDAGVYYRHTDHLNSTSILSDATGAKVSGSDVVYAPFGEIRTGNQSTLTDFGFTGQRLDSSTGGLMYYGARYYLPELRRFISADTIVSGMLNSQMLNRYSYAKNNPINYIDPTGHVACPPGMSPEECVVITKPVVNRGQTVQTTSQGQSVAVQLSYYGVTVNFKSEVSDSLATETRSAILDVVKKAGKQVSSTTKQSAQTAFKENIGPTRIDIYAPIKYDSGSGDYDYGIPGKPGWLGKNTDLDRLNQIQLSLAGIDGTSHYGPAQEGMNLIVHELAHNLTYNQEVAGGGWDWYTGQLYENPNPEPFGSSQKLTASQYWRLNSQVKAKSGDIWYEWSADLIGDWLLGNGGTHQQELAERALGVTNP